MAKNPRGHPVALSARRAQIANAPGQRAEDGSLRHDPKGARSITKSHAPSFVSSP
jgi:hypothetical protein